MKSMRPRTIDKQVALTGQSANGNQSIETRNESSEPLSQNSQELVEKCGELIQFTLSQNDVSSQEIFGTKLSVRSSQSSETSNQFLSQSSAVSSIFLVNDLFFDD